jgi:4'-phosphopantetheinyl transferase
MVLPIPPEGHADVWMAHVRGLSDDRRRSCEAILSGAERARLAKVAVEEARTQYLAAHALLRNVLSVYQPGPPSEWEFTVNAYGRPQLCNGQTAAPLHFSLSHTRGLVVCAIGGTEEMGIDAEWIDRELNCQELAEAFFAPSEITALQACSGVEKTELFFSFWTLKEAYSKARGMGLSLPLKEFWFELDHGDPEIILSAGLAVERRGWRFKLYSPTPKHRMAVAASFPASSSIMQVNLRTVEITGSAHQLYLSGADADASGPAAISRRAAHP